MKNILETTSMKPVLQRLQRYRDNETLLTQQNKQIWIQTPAKVLVVVTTKTCVQNHFLVCLRPVYSDTTQLSSTSSLVELRRRRYKQAFTHTHTHRQTDSAENNTGFRYSKQNAPRDCKS